MSPVAKPAILLAEFGRAADVLHAAEAVRDAGYTQWDVHSPFPIHGMDRAMGLEDSRLGWTVLLFALVGLSGAFVMMSWMGGVDYPFIAGGKPPGAIPPMAPILFELTILFSAFGTVLGMLHLNRLPHHNHPVFESERFRAASDDKFFLSIDGTDPKFDVASTRALLEAAHATSLEAIEGADAMTRWTLFSLALFSSGGSVACRGQVSEATPILVERNMYDQERYDPQAASHFFGDHGAMRPPVVGTVPQEKFEEDEAVATGVLPDASGYVLTVPEAVVERSGGLRPMVRRGRERFDIFCAPCHGRTGDGKSLVTQAGFPQLPKLDEERVCAVPDGQIYATIVNGVRNMPPYAAQLEVDDRWAVVAYVRALELHQITGGGAAP